MKKMRKPPLVPLWSIAAALAFICHAPPAVADEPLESSAVFAWLDSLGFPSAAGKQYGWLVNRAPIAPVDVPLDALTPCILLSEDAKSLCVFTSDFRKRTIARPADGTVLFEAVPLRRELKKYFPEGAPKDKPGTPDLRPRRVTFWFARVAMQQGDRESAERLARIAAGPGEAQDSVIASLSVNIAEVLYQEWMVDIGDRRTDRARLLAFARWYVKSFPKEARTEQVAGYEVILTKMQKDQRPVLRSDKHAQRELEQFDDLIFRLRDQEAYHSNLGSINIFTDPRGPDSPAAKLVAIGKPAIPRLIEALDDDSLTRCIVLPRMSGTKFVVRVGDCAMLIIQKILGKRVDLPYRPFLEGLSPAVAQAYKATMTQWWAEHSEDVVAKKRAF